MTLEFFNRPKNPKIPSPHIPPGKPVETPKSPPKKSVPPKKGK